MTTHQINAAKNGLHWTIGLTDENDVVETDFQQSTSLHSGFGCSCGAEFEDKDAAISHLREIAAETSDEEVRRFPSEVVSQIDTGEAGFEHADLGVSVCGRCKCTSLNLIREKHGFVLACARCESTLMDPFYPPGWEDEWNPASGDDEETLAIPSFDALQVTYSGGHAYLSGPAEAWGRLKRAADDIHRELTD